MTAALSGGPMAEVLMRPGSRLSLGARREEILAGALAAFADGSLHNPSLKAIGKRFGLEPAHILYYFKSREGLLREVIERRDNNFDDPNTKANPCTILEDFVDKIDKNSAAPGFHTLYLEFAIAVADSGHPAHDYIQDRFRRRGAAPSGGVRGEASNRLLHRLSSRLSASQKFEISSVNVKSRSQPVCACPAIIRL